MHEGTVYIMYTNKECPKTKYCQMEQDICLHSWMIMNFHKMCINQYNNTKIL